MENALLYNFDVFNDICICKLRLTIVILQTIDTIHHGSRLKYKLSILYRLENTEYSNFICIGKEENGERSISRCVESVISVHPPLTSPYFKFEYSVFVHTNILFL